MISVMNNECEFATKSDAVEEPPTTTRVSEDAVDRSGRGTDGEGVGGGGSCMNFGVSDRIGGSPERRLGAVESEGNVRVSEDEVSGGVEFENGRSDGVGASLEDDSGGVDREIESRVSSDSGCRKIVDQEMGTEVSEIKDGEGAPREGVDQFDSRSDRKEDALPRVDAHELEGGSVSQYESLLSKFDDYVANGMGGAYGMGTSRASSHALEVGEMVWGKVKSHPWWPGHIFNEALADPLVRRTKREGHVLVAFFGDSSYGWFLPDELVPFDTNFAEKSRQTTAKTFLKAVEEAVDEVGRRCGLRVVCQCRNPYTFRPKRVPGYFEVDVPDYETGGIYSADQISNARESFRPEDTLSFVKQLALAPRDSDQKNIRWIKNKATVYAYRRAIYEEYDETYAQAFGVQTSRPSPAQLNANRHLYKEPPRAPLSGPLVIAEALGSRKGSTKNLKGKMKKERYLFKRREEPVDFRPHQFNKGQASSSSSLGQTSATISPGQATASINQGQASSSSTCEEGPSTFATGDYVFQKRAPSASSQVNATKVESPADFGVTHMDQAPAHSTHDKKDAIWESKDTIVSDVAAGPANMGGSDMVRRGVFSEEIDVVPPPLQQDRYQGQIARSELPSPVDAKIPVQNTRIGTDGKVKKAKALKRSMGDLASDSSSQGEKKKKRKKESLMETSAGHPLKPMPTGKGGSVVAKLAAQPVQIGSMPRDSRFDHQTKEEGTSASLSSSGVTMAMDGLDDIELKVPELLSDLRDLALNPYHGRERNRPQIVMKFFLAFRSLKYEKSLSLSPPAENEPVEGNAPQSSPSIGASENLPSENVRVLPSVKLQKPPVRPNDPLKAGRKRAPSDRQEGNALKKMKKINDLKSLAAEKKASQKTLETPRGDGKETVAALAPAPPKPVRQELKPVKQDPKVVKQDPKPFKLDPAKKTEPSARVEEPTMLLMKFPPRTSLPSIAELKARFVRFGPLDHSSTRVFWKSLTCRVVFRYKHDAEAAHRYAVKNNSLFGNVSVKYTLRELEVVAPELPDSGKGRGEDTSSETPQPRDAAAEQRVAPTFVHGQAQQQQQQQQPVVQLKSCLKKPSSDEGGTGSGGRGTSRVKFLLGTGEEGHRGEQTMVANRNFNNHATSIADAGSTSVAALEFNSKNFQKVISPPPFYPPPPSLLPQFSRPPHDIHHTEVGIRHGYNNNNTLAAPPPANNVPTHLPPFPNTTPAAPPPANPGFNHKMLSLMNRAEDIVTRVKNYYGYMPYHPL